MQHPVPRAKKLIRAHDAHRHDRHPKFLRHTKYAFLKFLHMPVARSRSLRESNQAHSGVERLLRALRHDFEALAARLIRHRNITEASHQPTINRNPEMRLKLKPAHKLRYRRINHKRIKQIHMVANENARSLRIESG